MGKSSGATLSKIQVDIASNCCQMAKNDRILADERPLEHFLAILAHFMPIYTRIFENGTARLRCPSGVSRALFCRSETISKVGNIKIMSASSPFFFSPPSPPFSFLSRVVSRLMGVQKTRFRCRSGQNGQIFRSHLFKNPGRYIYIYIYIYIYTIIKRWRLHGQLLKFHAQGDHQTVPLMAVERKFKLHSWRAV